MTDFLEIYENAVPPEMCKRIIHYYDQMDIAGFATNRRSEGAASYLKSDNAISLARPEMIVLPPTMYVITEILGNFWDSANAYIAKYDIIRMISKLGMTSIKIQKTKPGGEGYHIWHFENGSRDQIHRVLAWTLYLNDIDEGGETEFLYLSRRITAKAGRLAIWPAGFTHTHRGNPPLSQTKYIATGWLELIE